MNVIDQLIGFVSPQAGLRRVRARVATDALTRRYEGAAVGRRTEGWVASGTDANAEVGPALSRLRDRARDLVRNNAYAAKAVTALATNLIGTGIIPRARADDPALAEAADVLWSRFVRECDAGGHTDFFGLQTLIARTMVESGECLVRLRRRQTGNDLVVPFQIQVLEPDHLDSGRDAELSDGRYIRHGIEFDPLGAPAAYWLFPRHPGDCWFGGGTSVRVPAGDVLHVYDMLRPGQFRGVTWFAPALMKLRDLDDFDEAELVRKKIEACFCAFVFGGDTEETIADASTDDQGKRIERFRPGMITYLPPGRDVRFGQPSSSPGYAECARVQLHAVAAALGLTYELLTGDLSQVNYSSIRAGLLEFRRRIEQLQWNVLVPGLCRPVWRRFVDTAQAAGVLGPGEIDAEWTPPRFEAVDPLKDVQADILAVRAGFMTMKEAIARQGYDPAAVLAEIAATFAEIDRLGIVLDTDPRKSTRTGQDKPMQQMEGHPDA
ncbi:MAG: phage portal protein [Alphaproteobacteria bacterium]